MGGWKHVTGVKEMDTTAVQFVVWVRLDRVGLVASG